MVPLGMESARKQQARLDVQQKSTDGDQEIGNFYRKKPLSNADDD